MRMFDYEKYNPVGYVDILPNGNANIEILGYVDNTNDYHALSSKESIELFPPKGRVFAHNFIMRNDKLNKSLVSISVIPNEKEGDRLDAYIWDKSGNVYEFGQRVTILNVVLNEDGENNFCIFQENDLIETDEDKYILSGDNIYYIKANSNERLIPYWKVANINVVDTPYGKKYLESRRLPDKDGVIDITNDDQLINWFMNKILKKHWTEIKSGDSYKAIETHITTALTDMKNLPTNVYHSRLDRLKTFSANFVLTLEELNDISTLPFVQELIIKTVDAHKQAIVSEQSEEYRLILNHLKEEHEAQLEIEEEHYANEIKNVRQQYESMAELIANEESVLKEKLDEKKLEIELFNEDIALKTEEVKRLDELIQKANERKADLVSDFAIIRDVLGVEAKASCSNVQETETNAVQHIHLQSINNADTECMMYEAFGKSLEETLNLNKLPAHNATTISELLAVYSTILVPDIAYALSIIHASQRCYYAVEYVNVGWKSFDNLWAEGLGCMTEHCYNEPDIMHYLILQNINLTYLPNFMQPLVDIQMGVTKYLVTNNAFPANLRILCTITPDEVIPMSKKCLRYFGCIEKPLKEVFVSGFQPSYNVRLGYLSPAKLAERANCNPTNFYKNYINEQQA